MGKSPSASTYQLKLTLNHSKPVIWRRLKVASDTTLAMLHSILQITMGWEDYHLHEFLYGNKRYGVPEDEFDRDLHNEFEVSLGELLKREGDSLRYLYDFGDSWGHTVVLEKISARGKASLPQCTAGARACPPEDVGGIPGYERMLKILRKPSHEEYEETQEWLGDDFDPAAFDKAVINQELERFAARQQLATLFVGMVEELGGVIGDEPPNDAEQGVIEQVFPEGTGVGDRQPNYDGLHGYLTAIICAPTPVQPMEWMLDLCEAYHLEFTEQQYFTALMQALLKFHNELALALAEGRPYLPEAEDIASAPIGTTAMELWCDGFLRGIMFNEVEWFDLEDDEVLEEVESSMALISAIAMRELQDKTLSPEAFSEKMGLVQSLLPKAVLTLYDLARSEHYAHLLESMEDDWEPHPQPAASTKIGRNEPCPCGSGLKYKKCCINKVVPLH